MPPKQKEKPEAVIRKLAKLESNKTCVDCTEKMPSYINLTHRTFVCTKCSGIHRELQFKVKGISMSEFTQENVNDMSNGGNAVHNAKYLARHNSREVPIPNGSDVTKLREFIKMKYEEKRWYSGDGSSNSSQSITSNPSPVSQDTALTKKSSFHNGNEKSQSALPTSTKPAATPATGLDLLDLLDALPSAPAPAPTPQSSFDAFGSSYSSFPSSNSQPANTNSGFDLFSASSAPTPPTTPAFGGPQNTMIQNQFGFDFGPPTTAAAPQQHNFNSSNGSSVGGGAFGMPPSNQNPTPSFMPFIQLNPPSADSSHSTPSPAPAPAPANRDFSAFDDIAPIPTPQQQQHQQSASSNPYDNRQPPGPQHSGNPFGAPGSVPVGYPPQYHQQQQQQHVPPYGYPPQQPQPYPPHPSNYPPHMSHNPFMQPQAPQALPPAQYGYPPPAFGPGGAAAATATGGYPHPGPAAPPVPPAAPDPFAVVGGLGWGGVQSNAPPPSHPPSQAPPVPAVTSTNPFDLF